MSLRARPSSGFAAPSSSAIGTEGGFEPTARESPVPARARRRNNCCWRKFVVSPRTTKRLKQGRFRSGPDRIQTCYPRVRGNTTASPGRAQALALDRFFERPQSPPPRGSLSRDVGTPTTGNHRPEYRPKSARALLLRAHHLRFPCISGHSDKLLRDARSGRCGEPQSRRTSLPQSRESERGDRQAARRASSTIRAARDVAGPVSVRPATHGSGFSAALPRFRESPRLSEYSEISRNPRESLPWPRRYMPG